MKICHLTSAHPYKDIRIFLKECRSLTENYEVHLVAPDAPNEVIDNVHVHGVKKDYESRIQRATKTTKNVYEEAVKIDADLYHFHDPELIFVGLKLKKKGKKVIYDVHEDVPRQIMSKPWIPKPLRWFVARSFETIENYAAKRFDGVICATPYITERFEKIGCKAQNINNYPMIKELFTPNVNWELKERNVCFVGGISEIRGVRESIKAMDQTDATLILGGEFSNGEFYEEVKQLRGWKKVEELGFIDRQKVAEILSQSMAGLVLYLPEPNHINAQPNKMFEYMSANVPVISSNFPLWKEIIEGNNCGLCVNPQNIDEIAQAIQWIVDHPKEAEKMGKNGREAVETKYNWENESKSLNRFYQSILNSKVHMPVD